MSTDPQSFHVTVKALVVDDVGRVLLLRQRDGRWDLPGGRLEHGETLHECLARECREEMGVGCEILDPMPVRAWSARDREGVWRLVLGFRVRLESFDFVESEECVGHAFVARGDLDGLEVAVHVRPLRAHFP